MAEIQQHIEAALILALQCKNKRGLAVTVDPRALMNAYQDLADDLMYNYDPEASA